MCADVCFMSTYAIRVRWDGGADHNGLLVGQSTNDVLCAFASVRGIQGSLCSPLSSCCTCFCDSCSMPRQACRCTRRLRPFCDCSCGLSKGQDNTALMNSAVELQTNVLQSHFLLWHQRILKAACESPSQRYTYIAAVEARRPSWSSQMQ